MAEFKVPTMAEMLASGQSPEVLFWVGCAGSFDDRAKRITKAIAKILHHANVSFAVLGAEESCTGDPAKRAGNEFLFQMQAAQNIAVLNGYGIKRIVTGCPHCFNVMKNEYPELGGDYDVQHHSQFIATLIADGKLTLADDHPFKGRKITFHDPFIDQLKGFRSLKNKNLTNKKFDGIVLSVPHKKILLNFKQNFLSLLKKEGFFFDVKGKFRNKKISNYC